MKSVWAILALLIGVALVTTGCHRAKGGGWIPSTVAGKATFGFTAKCVETDDLGAPFRFYEGQLEWDDHGADVTFHGDVEIFSAPAEARSPIASRLARPWSSSSSPAVAWLNWMGRTGPSRLDPAGPSPCAWKTT